MKEELAKKILDQVKKDYELIAADYSAARPSAWRELAIFKKWVRKGDRVLDLGCGNGRLLDLLDKEEIDYLGVDGSRGLITIAQKRYPQRRFVVGEVLDLSIDDNYFDQVFSIAVFHHIPSKVLRQKLFQESYRALKPGGYLILTVWNILRQKTLLLLRYTILKLLGLSKLDFGDLFIPWAKKAQRYHHYFTRKELIGLAKKSGFKVMEIGSIGSIEGGHRSNLYLVAQKPVSE